MKKTYSEEFKATAVAQVTGGDAVSEVAAGLDVSPRTLKRWLKEAGLDAAGASAPPVEEHADVVEQDDAETVAKEPVEEAPSGHTMSDIARAWGVTPSSIAMALKTGRIPEPDEKRGRSRIWNEIPERPASRRTGESKRLSTNNRYGHAIDLAPEVHANLIRLKEPGVPMKVIANQAIELGLREQGRWQD